MYTYDDFNSGFTLILTPSYFLNSNLKPFPLMDTDVDYFPADDSVTALLDNWKKAT